MILKFQIYVSQFDNYVWKKAFINKIDCCNFIMYTS